MAFRNLLIKCPVFLFLIIRILLHVYRGITSFFEEKFPEVGVYPKGGKKSCAKMVLDGV
jgi:hypothetical protein